MSWYTCNVRMDTTSTLYQYYTLMENDGCQCDLSYKAQIYELLYTGVVFNKQA